MTTHHLYNIEQVEILKGPGAFLYGGNPLSGTVNLVRKRPDFKDFLHLSNRYGSFNTLGTTLDAGKIILEDRLSMRFNAMYERSDLYRDNKAYHMFALNPSLSWRPGRQSEFNVNFEYLGNDYETDSGIPLVYNSETGLLDQMADIDRTTSFQVPADYSDQEIMRFKLNYLRKLNAQWQISNKFYYTALEWQSAGTLLTGAYPAPDGTYQVSCSLQVLDDRQQVTGNQFEVALKMNWGRFKHQLLAGLDIHRLTDNFTIDVAPQIPGISLRHPAETYDAALFPVFPYQFGDAAFNVMAPYFVNMIHFSEKCVF